MSPFWHSLLIPDEPLGAKILRPVVVYLFLILGLRLAGKRELAQLNPFDLVVLLTLSNTVQNAIIGNDTSMLGGIIGATTLLGINYLMVMLVFRYKRVGVIVEGGPDVLIKDGRILEDRLTSERIERAELEAAARKQGFASLKDVDQAILYPGGAFCFIAKVPTGEAIHHHQVMAELHRLRQQVEAMGAKGS
ncbi:MAG: YetF domain-containing protein [Gemmatimonadales bacterium]